MGLIVGMFLGVGVTYLAQYLSRRWDLNRED